MVELLQRFEPNQHHYITGIIMGFLVELYEVTRESSSWTEPRQYTISRPEETNIFILGTRFPQIRMGMRILVVSPDAGDKISGICLSRL